MPDPTEAAALPRRPLGRTGLSVTPLCLGGGVLAGGVGRATFPYDVPEEQAIATLLAGFGGPINFFDTAANYGDGESERRFGLALRELGGLPAGCVLATKAGRNPATGEFSADRARRSVERSLRLLGLDRLQLLYLHDPEHARASFEEITAPGGALEALQRFQQDGVVAHLGIAAGPIDVLRRYLELGVFEAVITHNRYTLLNRVAEPLLDLAAARGIAAVNAAPYAAGILAKGPGAYPRYVYRDAPPDVVERARRIEDTCRRYDVPLQAAALQLSLRDPRIVSTVVGMSRPERIAETLALAAMPIPAALWPELDALAERDRDPQARAS